MTMQIADAFVGLRVIEFAQGVAAPYCGLLLGRNGADVDLNHISTIPA